MDDDVLSFKDNFRVNQMFGLQNDISYFCQSLPFSLELRSKESEGFKIHHGHIKYSNSNQALSISPILDEDNGGSFLEKPIFIEIRKCFEKSMKEWPLYYNWSLSEDSQNHLKNPEKFLKTA